MALIDALKKLHSKEKELQDEAFQTLMRETGEPVPWAYEIWDDMVRTLGDKDNRRRAIAAQVLANLAKSDPENRMKSDFPALLAVTRDERFVTARHCMESLWKLAVANPANTQMVAAGLAKRFRECAAEKNCTLIRYDITVVLRKIHDHAGDGAIRELSEQLIATETDEKYKKKYASVWKKR